MNDYKVMENIPINKQNWCNSSSFSTQTDTNEMLWTELAPNRLAKLFSIKTKVLKLPYYHLTNLNKMDEFNGHFGAIISAQRAAIFLHCNHVVPWNACQRSSPWQLLILCIMKMFICSHAPPFTGKIQEGFPRETMWRPVAYLFSIFHHLICFYTFFFWEGHMYRCL